ncbi:MAG: SpoIIE family protein phosphatase, partial [Desulfovermiculus sp.]
GAVMKFRTKLLILLLTVTLLPLTLSFIAQLTSIQHFGNKLARDTRTLLQDNAETLLHTLTTHYGQILKRDQAMAEMALRIQAQAVQARLSAQPPEDPSPIFFAPDYRSPQQQPEDLTLSSKHQRIDNQGNKVPIPVSYTQQVIYLAPGVDRGDVRQNILRLSTMSQVYRTLHDIQSDLFLWQYTALESGVHSSYPGKGAYPSDFDPRERLWYEQAVDQQSQIEQIMTDVSTGNMILTLAAPVFSQDGSLAGVTALDIDYRQFFADWEVPDAWADTAHCMVVVFHQERQRSLNRKLEILLHNQRDGQNRDWRVPVEQKFLDPSEPGMDRIIEDIRAGRSGVRKMPYQGEESLWAYGTRRDDEPFPLVIVPYHQVIAQAITTQDSITRQISTGLALSALLTVLAVAFAVFLAIRRSRGITEPVMQLAEAASRLAEGDFDARVNIRYCRELDLLGEMFNDMGQRLKEREKMKQSLELARIIQQHLLPDSSPACPGFDLCGTSIYCDETGGDYYDFIVLGQDNQSCPCPALALGDVSGHGIGTALVMATARAMLHALAEREGSNLETLLSELNRSLCRDTSDIYFMTLFYGLLDCERSTLDWISAGQAPLFLYRRSGHRIEHLDSSGIPLGIMEESSFDIPDPITFSPGDILLVCSDGVWECTNPQGEMFGAEQVDELLQELADRDAAGICDGFLDVLDRFREGQAPQDDITLLIVKALE